ncbi:transporter substrate-binding domain-containing protein [soil metagenome]
MITRNAPNQKPRRLARISWRRVPSLAVLVWLCLAMPPALGQSASSTSAPFVMGFDDGPSVFGSKWAARIYTEAFRRLNLTLSIGYYPLARRAALVDDGEIDGDGARVYGYGAAHPNLVRVEESVMEFSFGVYSASPAVSVQRLEDLQSTTLLGEYRRGIFLCETTLKKVMPPERLSDVTNELQGVKKLLAGRTDIYCDLDNVVRQTLVSPEIKDQASVRKVFDIGALPTYPYLHKKHAALAPRLAAILKQMKTEGLIDAYRVQAERELGWSK